ncbi:hypothetical protein T11_1895 [Trichinella zimbabwensis]|uniref:Uncharacterized protein n=1 Tax=Trichinella zimbabwensis TaxID=268475 RepID=A0A0V1GFI8_9BILA|nr:hypothetical protein T11_1895 [Trichinella zimbabwensis]
MSFMLIELAIVETAVTDIAQLVGQDGKVNHFPSLIGRCP